MNATRHVSATLLFLLILSGFDSASGNSSSGAPVIQDSYFVLCSPGGHSTVISAIIDSNGVATVAWVEWGPTAAYGNVDTLTYHPGQPVVSLPAAFQSDTIQGLETDSTYHYRIGAANSYGVTYGPDHLLQQSLYSQRPSVTTLQADSITSRSARVHASFSTQGALGYSFFELWSRSPSTDVYSPERGVWSDTGVRSMSEVITPLYPNTTYKYFPWLIYAHSPFVDLAIHGDSLSFTTLPDTNERGFLVALSVKGPAGLGTTLHFGVHTYATRCLDMGLGESELPPTPPPDGMESRFLPVCLEGVPTYLDLRNYTSPTQIDTYRVSFYLQFAVYPVTVSWGDLTSLYAGPVVLITPTDTVDMMAATSYIITDPDIGGFRIFAAGPKFPHSGPMIATDEASGISESGAFLSANIYPNSRQTDAWFEIGSTPSYDLATTVTSTGDAGGAVPIGVNLTSLSPNTAYHFRAVARSADTTTYGEDHVFLTKAVSGVPPEKQSPAAYALYSAYPNPFNPSTTIEYQLPATSRVRILIYNILGQLVATLADRVEQPGIKTVEWNASSIGSGVYFCRMEASSLSGPAKSFVAVRKLVLTK